MTLRITQEDAGHSGPLCSAPPLNGHKPPLSFVAMLTNHYYVYIMSNRRNGTLYVGVTNDLARRCEEHRTGNGGAFTKKHGLARLVYYEHHDDIEQAISREKRIKTWLRAWKVRLIHQQNPEWNDLAPNLLNELPMT